MTDQIVIRGARTHNLKNIDCTIPHGQLTVVTGVSGSGKSSLAFDTVYAEGQRRYVESLSAYARQFLERMEKPDVDFIDGLAPAVAIKQKNTTRNPRSTVATATEIYDYLRLLYARCGTVHCIVCDGIVKRDSVDEIAAAVLALGEGTRLYALFPVTPAQQAPEAGPESPAAEEAKPPKRPRKTAKKAAAAPAASTLTESLKERLAELRKRGFNRLYQGGNIYEFSTPESLLEIDFTLPVFVLIDRLVVSPENRARIVDAAEIGYREAGEILYEIVPREGEKPERERLRFSGAFECKTCHRVYREPEPRLFSFNNPFGACPRCQGFGNTIDFDLALIIPDSAKTLTAGAIDPWNRPKYRPWYADMRRAAQAQGVPLDVPWRELSEEHQSFILNGQGSFAGVRGFFEQMERKKYKLHVRVMLSKYRGYAVCPECKGQRLRAEARAVRISGKNICEASALTIRNANEFFGALTLTAMQQEIAGSILDEVRQRLHFLDAVGLDYLTLDRLASTLSGGEAQRIQLATSLGSRLVGALYVLDEPSIGLHTRDTAKLIRILENLRDLGNTILVVEHDPDVIRAADYLIDLGPGAGEFGGKLLAAGTVQQVEANTSSLTGKYLSGTVTIPVPRFRREIDVDNKRQWLRLEGARANNLKGIDVQIPLQVLTCITGVSGSGKSTLVHEVLYKVLAYHLGKTETGDPSHLYRAVHGAERLNDIVLVDQTPIGRTPRSNPVTYIKAFDAIRELFASQPEAQRRGYSAGYFSFNVPGGRCDVCEGDGTVTVEMQFLADVELPCEECSGSRYKASVLEIKYKGKSIHDVLGMTVKEALRFFAGHPKIVDKLAVLEEIGLGYLRLGQSATTLSGGEAQRVKLALHLASVRSSGSSEARKAANRILYILDEPTTGLHFEDVSKLLMAFKKLIDGGASLVVIEHNLDIIKSADWIIDLGPEGGTGGGQIVATGTPEEITRHELSHTGYWLARVLASHGHAASKTPEKEVVV
ncbi:MULTISPECIES: excinuclease ABC subunit UvrA [Acidobacterium]|uniref:UvrABC system protein A n=1 Tax=Acidobacterium capsulatum (strain ATCC 51196 / DSM 11244 / BCRC 80197 / JCM 7670 / NBRC 15755 / NCIMB 13165 / 161) TaxID=240015 RepID=C1F8N8_ACIC5|nr:MULTISPECIES: excinuclease ABC subunit UvrA [Acidobacterium]ACO31876.1 excinuclease ABC, A subunit [Acidobacterium capsulatum ATCC 51196]HCT61537.1 excinuclease ABC subunit A [Acidobacterium sp.]